MPPSLSAAVHRPADRAASHVAPFLDPEGLYCVLRIAGQAFMIMKVVLAHVVQVRGRQLPGLHAATDLAAGIPGVVIACVVSPGLLFFDKPFDGGQRVGVEVAWGQLRLQLPCLSGPAVVGAFGVVQAGVGGEGVEFVPGQMVASRQSPRTFTADLP